MEGSSRATSALFCDTNVLVRLLTNDPQEQALAAAETLDRSGDVPDVILTDVVIAELAYVLTTVYLLTAAAAADRILALLELPRVEVVDDLVVRDAISTWSSGRIDFADAYLAALNRRVEGSAVLSFDSDFDALEGVTRIEPALGQ